MVDYEEESSLLRCAGEEDSTTQPQRRRPFARAVKAPRDVVVDLSELAFADPSLMLDLAILAQRLRTHGQRLLVRGAQPHIVRLIEMVGLNRQPGVLLAV
ncbi:MAG TPA: STAS domain-containing protein [Solirubrobacteraceae bacterium]|nr:STAS domain-containing protein [Solirubrobacteraceae bacterium]